MELISGKTTIKGQITIPKELREKFNMSEGDRLRFLISEDGKEVRVEPVKRKKLSDAIGRIHASEPIDLEKIRAVRIMHGGDDSPLRNLFPSYPYKESVKG